MLNYSIWLASSSPPPPPPPPSLLQWLIKWHFNEFTGKLAPAPPQCPKHPCLWPTPRELSLNASIMPREPSRVWGRILRFWQNVECGIYTRWMCLLLVNLCNWTFERRPQRSSEKSGESRRENEKICAIGQGPSMVIRSQELVKLNFNCSFAANSDGINRGKGKLIDYYMIHDTIRCSLVLFEFQKY